MPTHKGGKKGSKKYGRNEAKCKVYKQAGRREKNKLCKLRKHIIKQPNDQVAIISLKKLEGG